jgi:molecular chaperone Hsp33
MLGATLKGEDKMTVKIEGNGPAGAIVVDSNGKGDQKMVLSIPNL